MSSTPMDTTPPPLPIDIKPPLMDTNQPPIDINPLPIDTNQPPMDIKPLPMDIKPLPMDIKPQPMTDTNQPPMTDLKPTLPSEPVVVNNTSVTVPVDGNNGADDALSYTRRSEFTSETFKIEIRYLPKHISYPLLKKLMSKLGLKPLKLKLIGGRVRGQWTHAFVTFRCDADRDKALVELDGHEWKGQRLSVKPANPVPDPLVSKRNNNNNNNNNNNKRLATTTDNSTAADSNGRQQHQQPVAELTAEQLAETLNTQVASLWRLPYAEQLAEKRRLLVEFLQSYSRQLSKIVDQSDSQSVDRQQLVSWLAEMRLKCPETRCCPLESIRSVSDRVDGYRNKCEFTVGLDKTVGFRLGLYRDGCLKVVAPPADCPIVGQDMRRALTGVQRYVRDVSQLAGFNPETHDGYWIQATIRTVRSGQSMVILAIHPQSMTADEINTEKQRIVKFFEDNVNEFRVTSLYLSISAERHGHTLATNLQHLYGTETISETINISPDRSLEFRISPLAFFQINTSAAELCYQSIGQLVSSGGTGNESTTTTTTTLLDICCGTGTIGLCLADRVKHVYGIELNADAVRDACFNARQNRIENCEFTVGKAEDRLTQVMGQLSTTSESDIVAVVDPPRAGLNNSIVKCLRGNQLVRKLVYVSCDPQKAIKNLIDLCRPTSKSYRGQPFVPVVAIPVDMFPHTNRCELIVEFERLSSAVSSPANSCIKTED